MRSSLKINGFFILLFLLVQVSNAQVLSIVEFQGLKKTKTAYLQRFIQSAAGQAYDSLLVKNDIQALKNLNFYYEVKAELKEEKEELALIFHLKEVHTLLPIISFSGIKGNFWLQLGAVDHNFLGRGINLGGYYRYYDRHSMYAAIKLPYLKGSNWGLSASFLKWSTKEPLRFDSVSTEYNYDNYAPELLLRYSFLHNHFLEGGFAYLYERYHALEPELVLNQPTNLQVGKLLNKLVHHYENVDYNWEFLEGFASELRLETVYTPIYKGIFWKVEADLRYFYPIGKTGNFATRLRLGIADNGSTPFPPFVLDSYVNVRGAGNRIARGTAEIALNLEYRQTIFKHKLGAIQAVGFVDSGALRTTGESLATFKDNTLFYGGLGARFYLARIYNFVLRADYAFNLADLKKQGFVLGVGQYF